ncbi:hypothetical protein [Pseudarthrobacter sp. NIBRBAC000502771]|uniref:hypothetical protein n=1 Tax=Pseudarthrobacter sp. NIBRBAC000502771 TaxID=2590774 RepID=UPI0011315FAD|nr:hypothetical protein [Pseudarthrobacter sp. NIBRBAC000502771]QDG61215.1 hypothetical protein NIBR502771_02095 [Pseudarthrobacter sp. NIBRBAC000502771]
MKNTTTPESNATTNPDVLLNLLARVSEAYDAQAKHLAELAELRKEVGRQAIDAGATYQRTGDAMGRDRSTAHILINGRAA